MKIGANYLNTTNAEAGATVIFKDEGVWEDSQYMKEDKVTPKRQFIMNVEYHGELKKMRINKTNSDALVAAYGDETQDWIDKPATIRIEKAMVAGKMTDCILLDVAVDGPAVPEVNVDEEFPG